MSTLVKSIIETTEINSLKPDFSVLKIIPKDIARQESDTHFLITKQAQPSTPYHQQLSRTNATSYHSTTIKRLPNTTVLYYNWRFLSSSQSIWRTFWARTSRLSSIWKRKKSWLKVCNLIFERTLWKKRHYGTMRIYQRNHQTIFSSGNIRPTLPSRRIRYFP